MLRFFLCLFVYLTFLPLSHAQTLSQALTDIYTHNAQLLSKRAEIQANIFNAKQSKKGWYPSLSMTSQWGMSIEQPILTASGSQDYVPSASLNKKDDSWGNYHAQGYVGGALELRQSLIDGGRTRSLEKYAKYKMLASLESLKQVEQDVLLQGVKVYFNVLYTQSVLELRENDVKILDRQLEGVKQQFNLGELTPTNVASAKALLSGAKANLIRAKGNVRIAKMAYKRVVGSLPKNLIYPQNIAFENYEQEDVMDRAHRFYPGILSAYYLKRSAMFYVDVKKSDLRPQVNAFIKAQMRSDYGVSSHFSRKNKFDRTLSPALNFGVEMKIPLSFSALNHSQVYETTAMSLKSSIDYRQSIEQVSEKAFEAWQTFQAVNASLNALEMQVKSYDLVFSSTQKEQRLGLKTLLDVLNAKQDLLKSQVDLLKAKRDQVISFYQLKFFMGNLNAKSLNLPVVLYNPVEKNNFVKYK